jgi:hypothetical protein
MKMSRVAVLLFAAAVLGSRADETNLTLNVDGVTYSNVTFGTVTPSSVSIRHKTGAASVPLWKLPPELQQRFGYNPDRARQHLAGQAELEQQRQGALQKLRAQNLRKIGNKLYDFRAIEQLLGVEQQWRKSGLDYQYTLGAANKYGGISYQNILNLQPGYDHWSGLCDKIRDCQKLCVVGVVRSVDDNSLYVECMDPRAYSKTVSVG